MKTIFSRLLPLAAILLLPAFAQAQETAAAMRGRILDESGNPVAGASVVITDQRTNVSVDFTSNATGTFLAPNLPVGGPYSVAVNGREEAQVSQLALGDTYNLTITLRAEMEEIITFGQAQEIVETAIGPTATFGFDDLDSGVSFERDIKEVYAVDPRMSVDFDLRGTVTNCMGKHPRFNSTTLDGVNHGDRFGLNTNGYSTATGMPFPYDAIQMVNVELAPFDPKYGGFSACNINAVTRSGTNDWVGSAFYEFTDQSLIADELDGLDLSAPEDYKREKIGFAIGGPIIKDRLHFFAAYEETEQPVFLAMGYAGSGNGEERSWLSQDQYNTINDAAQTLYQYDTGGQPGNGSTESENYLLRLDWQINGDHSLTGIYNYYDGVESRASDGDSDEFEFANHFYNKGSESETITMWLDSQWTDSFSTQVYYTNTTMDDLQETVGPRDVGDHQIDIGNDGTVYLGADDSRQANSLANEADLLKLQALWLVGDHAITAGYEREELNTFNIFVQHSRGGEWDYWDDSEGDDPACALLDAQGRHDDPTCGTSGIDKFVLGRPSSVAYGSGGGSNNALDAAADFTNVTNSLYVSDEIYFPNSDLTLTAGLRYDWLTSSDSPNYNEALSNAIGIRNDTGLDGLSILMPRLGFNWGINDEWQMRGGIGLFSGGNPNVWLSNAWSNDGITNVQTWEGYQFVGNPSILDGGIPLNPGTPGGQIPTAQFDEVAAVTPQDGSISRTVSLDPNYEMPAEWKVALGATWEMPWGGWLVDMDYMYTRLEDGAQYVDVSQEIVGETILGQPIYGAIPGAGSENLMLTNTSRTSTAQVISLVFNKSWDWGMDLLLGYAWTEADDVSPMTSFTANSSWSNIATNDINDPKPGPSNYVRRNRFTTRLDYQRAFFGDNLTRFTLIGFYQEGQPNTYTFDAEFGVLQAEDDSQHLLYIPDGPADANVIYGPNFPVVEFLDWAQRRGLKGGQFVSRNSVSTKSSFRADLRIDQEIPLGMPELKARAFMKIYNFTNLLNDDWGHQYDSEFFSRDVVDLSALGPNGEYVYDSFSPRSADFRRSFASIWEIRFGIDIRFN